MIDAVSMPRDERHHARFVEMLPRIRRFGSYIFRHEHRSERDDLIAEVVARAYLSFARLVERNMVEVAFPTALARYACKQIRAGRRVGNRCDMRDLMSSRAKKQGVLIHGLWEQDERGHWEELAVEDKRTRPADVAACRIDFRAWLATLSVRNRRIAEALAVGTSTTDVAERFRVSMSRVSQLRRELHEQWREFHGELVAEAA